MSDGYLSNETRDAIAIGSAILAVIQMIIVLWPFLKRGNGGGLAASMDRGMSAQLASAWRTLSAIPGAHRSLKALAATSGGTWAVALVAKASGDALSTALLFGLSLAQAGAFAWLLVVLFDAWVESADDTPSPALAVILISLAVSVAAVYLNDAVGSGSNVVFQAFAAAVVGPAAVASLVIAMSMVLPVVRLFDRE